MELEIVWRQNSLSFGEDDPHVGTEKQGFHAGLQITDGKHKYFLRCSDFEYGLDLPKLLKEIVGGK